MSARIDTSTPANIAMMLPSTDSSLLHRRPPAHLSVSLRNESPAVSSADSAQALPRKRLEKLGRVSSRPARKASDNSNDSGNSSGIEKWFDQSNSRPTISIDQTFVDGEPPFFLRRHESSNSLHDRSEPNRDVLPSRANGEMATGVAHAATNGSSADEYRSVIDDLTIENRKLREKLKKYENSSCSPHLDKDRLFEVKIHGLPAKKKRELEETLRSFAASIDGSRNSSTLNMKVTSRNHRHQSSGQVSSHNPPSSSTSNSRPVDSAYASMSNSGPTSTFASTPGLTSNPQPKYVKGEKVQSYLHNIPQGLLPRKSTVMTEREKRKAVVRRLEQLFTGKTSLIGGDHSHPLQQQEVSRSATRADRAADGLSSVEGLREANMLPYEMDVDPTKPGKISDDSSHETPLPKTVSDSTPEDSQDDSSPDQRPTRPLDLDPDRAQIPSDNVEYIRHLGISAPQFTRMESADAAADADGWIFLNLLVNMAQLHIINVTPDFVRSAVADVSEKFQLSKDGRKVRWRGGSEGTRLSSDSGASSTRNRSPHESDSLDEITRKRRKRRKIKAGRFASVPIEGRDITVPVGSSYPSYLHYKPLFRHQGSSSEESNSYDESDSPLERASGYGSGSEKYSLGARHKSQDSRSSSVGRRGEDGTIVFYSGAQFCTDLSRDRGNISTPAHITGVGKDGYSNHTLDALGSKPRNEREPLCHANSGSNIPFRPFKDYSRVPDFLQSDETRPKTPDLVSMDPHHMNFSPKWALVGPNEDRLPLDFSASGLGGTVPADHFITKVRTQRTILDGQTRARLSKFSAPGPALKRFYHRIPGSFLDAFKGSDAKNSPDSIAFGLASLQAFRSPSPQIRSQAELPVKIKIISTYSSALEPSPLPAPSGYYAASSSTEDDSDASSSSSGISYLHRDKSILQRSITSVSDPVRPTKLPFKDDERDIDEGSSIDMLAPLRELDPDSIAAKEHEFERITRKDSSKASVAVESGYSSSDESESLTDESEGEEDDESV